MVAIEHAIVEFLSNLFTSVGWAGVVIAMAIESACIPLPSEVTLPLAGWLLVQDKGLAPFYSILVGFWGAVGCTIGSLFIYWVGAVGGRPLLFKYGKYVLIQEHHVHIADRWFARWGNTATFLARLLPVVRTFISLPAGMARVPIIPFTIYAFVGSFIWSWILGYLGYIFGANWEQIRNTMRPFDIPIVAVILIAAGMFFYRSWRASRKSPVIPGEVGDVT
jgi:membrane protein DedA with SNARE-associated domain